MYLVEAVGEWKYTSSSNLYPAPSSQFQLNSLGPHWQCETCSTSFTWPLYDVTYFENIVPAFSLASRMSVLLRKRTNWAGASNGFAQICFHSSKQSSYRWTLVKIGDKQMELRTHQPIHLLVLRQRLVEHRNWRQENNHIHVIKKWSPDSCWRRKLLQTTP